MLQGTLRAAPACQHPCTAHGPGRPRVLLVQTNPTQLRPATLSSWQQTRLRHPGEGSWCGFDVAVGGLGPSAGNPLTNLAVTIVLIHICTTRQLPVLLPTARFNKQTSLLSSCLTYSTQVAGVGCVLLVKGRSPHLSSNKSSSSSSKDGPLYSERGTWSYPSL
jgi:hypothetical protein